MSFSKIFERLGSPPPTKKNPSTLIEPLEPEDRPVLMHEQKTEAPARTLTIPELWQHGQKPENVSEALWYSSVQFGFVFLRDYLNNGSTFEEKNNPCKTRCKKSLWVISALLLSGISGGLTLYGFMDNNQLKRDRTIYDAEGLVIYSGIKEDCPKIFNTSEACTIVPYNIVCQNTACAKVDYFLTNSEYVTQLATGTFSQHWDGPNINCIISVFANMPVLCSPSNYSFSSYLDKYNTRKTESNEWIGATLYIFLLSALPLPLLLHTLYKKNRIKTLLAVPAEIFLNPTDEVSPLQEDSQTVGHIYTFLAAELKKAEKIGYFSDNGRFFRKNNLKEKDESKNAHLISIQDGTGYIPLGLGWH